MKLLDFLNFLQPELLVPFLAKKINSGARQGVFWGGPSGKISIFNFGNMK